MNEFPAGKIAIGLLATIIVLVVLGLTVFQETPSRSRSFPPPQKPPSEAPIVRPEAIPEKLPLTSAERAYTSTIVNQTTTVGDAYIELGNLLQNPQIGNEDWTLKVAIQLTKIQITYNKAMEMKPPDSMTNIHYKYVQGMKHYNTAIELIAQGIDKIEPELLEQATEEMYLGINFINEATQLILEFKETHK